MKKRILTIFLIFCISICSLLPVSFSATAGSYEDELEKAGFPTIYHSSLKTLHNKYPNWKFVALDTGVDFSNAVANERTPHSQQLIQKSSSNYSKGYYCTCSACYKNGSYVIQEGKSWVSASKEAVEYYLNPTNFLDEKQIFQFETTAYDSTHTQSGVETIISKTWMHNALITYKDVNGNSKTYVNSKYPNGIKYSQAIMESAKSSGLSAYYLASKIVQEVGGKNPTATSVSGTYSAYPGIYNYYNIGAYTGAVDGLKWAATNTTGYSTNCTCNLREMPTTSSAILAKLPSSTRLTFISATDTQPDGYKWYNVSVVYNGITYNGYLRSDLVNYGSSDKYGRPWTNPFVSIYNGAKYIAANFASTQSTGYLQKFNVNPASSNMYNHEYMANVQAAASEAVTSYNAYSSAGLLSSQKTFVIPVFKNMPGMKSYSADIPAPQNLAAKGIINTQFSLSCDVVKGASGYDIAIYKDGSWKFLKSIYACSTTIADLNAGTSYKFKMRAFIKNGSSITYSTNWSNEFSVKTKTEAELAATIEAPTNIKISNIKADRFTVTCSPVSGANGYELQYFSGGKWVKLSESDSNSITATGLKSSTQYKIRLRVSKYIGGVKILSSNYSAEASVLTAPGTISGVNTTARSDDGTRLRIEWNRRSDCDGYAVYRSVNGVWKLSGYTADNYWIFNVTPGYEYYYKVAGYKGSESNLGEFSEVHHTCASCVPVEKAPVLESNGNGSLVVRWEKTRCHGYLVQYSTSEDFKNPTSEYIKSQTSDKKTFTNLKSGTKYYVRIRSYRYLDSSIVYGPYSPTGSAIVK